MKKHKLKKLIAKANKLPYKDFLYLLERMDMTRFSKADSLAADGVKEFRIFDDHGNSVCYKPQEEYPWDFSDEPEDMEMDWPDGLDYDPEEDVPDAPPGYEYATEEEVKRQMKKWLRRVPFKQFLEAIEEEVIGQKNIKDLLLNVYFYIKNVAFDREHHANTLICAPSGNGKTHLYRTLREYFRKEIPGFLVYQIDMSNITESGYQGGRIEQIVLPMIEEESSLALVFLDEIDKKFICSSKSDGENMNRAVQSEILTLIEGRMIDGIDTNKTCFIGLGSFDLLREDRNHSRKKIGFSRENESEEETHYKEITEEDLYKAGGIPELIGRFSKIVNFYPLSVEAVNKIIDKQLTELAEAYQITIKLEDPFRKHLVKEANTKTGCRRLRNIMQAKVSSLLTEAYISECEYQDLVISLEDENDCCYFHEKDQKKHYIQNKARLEQENRDE